MVDLDVFPNEQPRAPKKSGKKWNIASRLAAVWDSFVNQLYAFLILAAIIFGTIVGTRYMLALPERNDTDPPDGYSGLSVLIDTKTGCQYLATREGGVTPRLDKKGKHMCGDN